MKNLDKNVAQTGLRILFIIKLLLIEPRKKADLVNAINKNPILSNVSKDTISLDIETLNKCGFNILKKGRCKGQYYVLDKTPFSIGLQRKELKALKLAKKAAFSYFDFRDLISLYETLEKIAPYIENEKRAQELLNFGIFLKVNFDLVKKLDEHCKNNDKITILYKTPREIKPRKITLSCLYLEYFKNTDKLYLWGIADDYTEPVYLRADKILKIEKVFDKKESKKLNFSNLNFEISTTKNSQIEIAQNEQIMAIDQKTVKLSAKYYNKFNMTQRLLSFGAGLVGIGNKKFKNDVVKELKAILEVYK